MSTEDKKIKLNERVSVYGTGKVSTFSKGKEFKVHPELARKLVAAGKATDKKTA
ncbi:MAG: hypothetical protein LBJ63_02850 [Prevotellaceae bacterium]|jgi:hypothetical protein|nr:hypothetical protein [Prevotellaceae bacterium]